MADQDVCFAVRGKFRPVFGNRVVVVEFALLGQDVDGGGGHALADGVDGEEGVRGDRRGGGGISEAGAGVGDEVATVVDGDLETALLAGGDQVIEHRLKVCLRVRH